MMESRLNKHAQGRREGRSRGGKTVRGDLKGSEEDRSHGERRLCTEH